MSINRVSITGNLTRDPELRATAGGTQVLSFGVAVNDRRRNPQTGEWEDYPNFVDCTMFIDLTYADQRFQLFINVNDWGVPTFHISQIK